MIRDELAKIGLTVDIVLLDGNALVGQFVSGKPYDAIYFSLIPSDTDPALNLDFWLQRRQPCLEPGPGDAGHGLGAPDR